MKSLLPAMLCLAFLGGAPGQETAPLPDSADPGRGLDLGKVELTAVYEADFASPLRLVKEAELFEGELRVRQPGEVDWVLEGEASARIENGRLRLVNEGGHLVCWNTRTFPADFLLEFGVCPADSERGLNIVFFCAGGRDGGGIFDSGLPLRHGVFKTYHSGELDSYHVSYWATQADGAARGTAHIRKNRGFHLVAQGRDFIAGAGRGPHRVRLLKLGGEIQVEVNGKLSVAWNDDGQGFGPVLGEGFIGLRQMSHTDASEYTHFKVWAATRRGAPGDGRPVIPAAEPPGSATAPGALGTPRRFLPEMLVRDRIRVFYATAGEHAVAADDENANGIPDQVEDVMTQTWAAWILWTSLGFADPLTTERYQGARWLDVRLLSKEKLKSNGVAYDEIQHFGWEIDPKGTGSLCFDVATSVKAHANLTPAHEMFHVFQNSVCYFKNRWFTEGTARWSEAGLGEGGLPAGLRRLSWPPEGAALESVFAGAYDTAATYWGPLLGREDPAGKLPAEKLPADLRAARYVNGEPVLKDEELSGWDLLRDIIHALGAAAAAAQGERGLDRWSEAEQFSPANNAVIHRVVREVVAKRRHAPGAPVSGRLDREPAPD